MSFTNAQLAQKISDLIDYWTTFLVEHKDWLGGSVGGGPGLNGKYPLTDWNGNTSLIDSPAQLADNVNSLVTGAQGYASAASASADAAAASASTATTQAGLADTARIAAETARTQAQTAETGAVDAKVTAIAQANLATDRVGYAEEWANKPFNTLVSVAAGGNGTDEYSARHWAEVASGFAGDIDANLYFRLSDNEIVTGLPTFNLGMNFLPMAAPAWAEGRVFYDSTEKALSYYNDEADVTINLGQENVIRVRNTTGVTITNGSAVYINGSQGANLPTVALARADALDTSRCIGLATHDIENNSNGYVTTLGLVNNLNTSAYSAGDTLYLSPSVAGGLQNTRPTTGWAVVVGKVTVSNVSIGQIKVLPGITVQRSDVTSASQNETVSGNWTVTGNWVFQQDTIGDFMFRRNGTTGAVGVGFRNDDATIKGYIGFGDDSYFKIWKGVDTSVVFQISDTGNITQVGTITTTGNVTVNGTGIFNALSPAIKARAGDGSATFNGDQIQFGYNQTDNYRHAIGTRHNASGDANNAIDFYLWNFGTDAAGSVGTFQAMTLDQTGSNIFTGLGVWGTLTTGAGGSGGDSPLAIRSQYAGAGWNYVSMQNSGGTRTAYFGMDPSNNFVFDNESGGNFTFLDAVSLNSTLAVTGTATFNNDVAIYGGANALTLSAGNPKLKMIESDHTANQQRWDFVITSGQLRGRLLTDDELTIANFLTVTRNAQKAEWNIIGGDTSGDNPLRINQRINFRGDGVMTWGPAMDAGTLSWLSATNALIYGASTLTMGVSADQDVVVLTSGTATVNGALTATGNIAAANIPAYNSFASGAIVTRHPSGYIFTNYLNMTADYTTSAPTGIAVETGSDKYVRWQTPANFFNELNPRYARELSASDNLNNLVAAQAGFYYQTANADTTGNNYPNGHAGSLIVQKSAGNATQLYITYPTSDNRMFYRSNYNAGWSSWVEVITNLNAQTISGVKTFSAQPVFSNAEGILFNDANTKIKEGTGNSVRLNTDSGYIDIGPQNTTFAHFQTDRGQFYFNVPIHVNGTVFDYNGGTARPYFKLASPTGYTSGGNVTYSTSAPSGGSSGDLWFKYT